MFFVVNTSKFRSMALIATFGLLVKWAQVFVERLLAAKAMESQLAMMSKIHSAEQSTLLESIRDLVERRRQRKHSQEERNGVC